MTEPLVDPGLLPLFSRPRIVPPPPATVPSLQRALPTAHGQSTRPRPHLVGTGTPHARAASTSRGVSPTTTASPGSIPPTRAPTRASTAATIRWRASPSSAKP